MGYEMMLTQMEKAHAEHTLEQEDMVVNNHTYKDEQELLELVRRGDTASVRIAIDTMFPGYPDVIGYSNKKNEEYMAIITVALVSRAAVEAGMTSAESFAMADVYLKKIATAQDVAAILKYRNCAIVAYTQVIAAKKSSKKSGMYVEECKNYIAAHIFKKIGTTEIADALGLNAVYLERIFKESEGMTIGQYIHQEKIDRAKNLLIYSGRSILEISDYLSFSSQSHFGKVFKQETGMTPKQYREREHVSGY